MELMRQIIQTFSKPLVWWVVIASWEMGILVRGGKTIHVLNPGIHFRIPFLDRIYVQSIRLQTIRCRGLTVTAKDRKTVSISFAIEFCIADICRLYEKLASPDATVISRVESFIASHIIEYNSNEITQKKLSSLVQQVINSTDWAEFGLGSVSCLITSCAIVRPLRLISADYHEGGNLSNLDYCQTSGERQ